MKKALTTREKTIQMLLERWRQKQEIVASPPGHLVPTPLFAQKPRIKISKTRRQGSH